MAVLTQEYVITYCAVEQFSTHIVIETASFANERDARRAFETLTECHSFKRRILSATLEDPQMRVIAEYDA